MANSRKSVASLEGLQKPYIVTPGNIMTPVQAHDGGVGMNFPAPTARGFNKAPGDDPFPSGNPGKKPASPLSAFGLGGDK